VKLAKEYSFTDIVSYKEGDIVEQILKLVTEKVDSVILAERVKHGEMLNYKYEGFDKIPEAFGVMDNK
jgi:hypothetical protein